MMVAFRRGGAIDNAIGPSDWDRMKSYPRMLLLGVGLLLPAVTAALGQSDYPDRPVRVIVPFAPGGVVDVMARLLSQKMSVDLGKNFYLQNLGGAGGDIGTRNAGASANDGYTILITSSRFVVNTSLYAQVPSDKIKVCEPISIAAYSPDVLLVNPSFPAK